MSNTSSTRRVTSARKRGNGQGSLSLNKARDRYTIRIPLADGSRRRRTINRQSGEDSRAFRSRAEATLADMVRERDGGRTASDAHTVASYVPVWLSEIEGTVAASTHSHYARVAEYYLIPALGKTKLASIDPPAVRRLDEMLYKEGRAYSTRRRSRTALSGLLRHAHTNGLVDDRVATATSRAVKLMRADQVDDPTAHRTTEALEPAQTAALLAAAREERLHPLIVLLAHTGMRRQEVMGLAWDDVDLGKGTMVIRRAVQIVQVPGESNRVLYASTKTSAGRRTLHIPAQAVEALKKWKTTQAEDRLAAGTAWAQAPIDVRGEPVDLVFRDEAGRPTTVNQVRGALSRAGTRAGLGPINPHRLRHSAVSLLLSLGYNAADIAAIMGHASAQVTLTVYAHAFRSVTSNALHDAAAAISNAR